MNTIKLIKEFGFRSGFSTEARSGDFNDDIHDFPRTFIKNDPVNLNENILMALGIRQKYLHYFKNLEQELIGALNFKKNNILKIKL